MMTSQFMIMSLVDLRQGYPDFDRPESQGRKVTLESRSNLEHFVGRKFRQAKGQRRIHLKLISTQMALERRLVSLLIGQWSKVFVAVV